MTVVGGFVVFIGTGITSIWILQVLGWKWYWLYLGLLLIALGTTIEAHG